MRPATLGILGLGPLGAALAQRARQGGVAAILGWSPVPRDRVAAVREGILDDAPARSNELLSRCDLLVLAGDPLENLRWLETLGPRVPAGRFLTDLGTAKRAIVGRAAALGLGDRFAGSRPAQDLPAAWTDGMVVYVTPVPAGERAAREIAHFWEAVCGAQCVLLDAERHDAQVALSAQLPPLVAAVLASVLAARLPRGVTVGATARDLTAPLRDEERAQIAALWQNRDHLAGALRDAAATAERLAATFDAHDAAVLAAELETVRAWRRGIDS